MKKCQDIENLLPLYWEGVLADAEKKAVDEHLAGCVFCQKELAGLQKAGQLVADVPQVEEPPWFQQKIMARVREEADKKSIAQKWFYPLRMKIPVQIAATLVIAVLAVYIHRSGDEQVKEILPGIPRPAVEMQTLPAPAPMPQAGDTSAPVVSREKAAARKNVKQDKPVTGSIAAGGREQKSEKPEDRPGADETDAYRVKGLAESKEDARRALQAKQNQFESAGAGLSDQEKKAPASAAAKKRDSYPMAAPAAPQSMAASAPPLPEARVFMRVSDLNAAAAEVEKTLIKYSAKKVTKQSVDDRVLVQAEIAGRDWQGVLTKLKEIGLVKEKVVISDRSEHGIFVLIEIALQ